MGARTAILTLTALCSVLAASDCRKGNDAAPPTETGQTVQGTTPSAGTTEQSKGLDPQVLRDSARASIGRDSAAMTRALRSAADFARRQADRANQTAKEAYIRSAAEMDTLAASISAGVKRSEQTVDSAFARLNYAEGLDHMAEAMNAWAAHQRSQAAEELQAATDNLERAAQDARVKLDARTTKAAAAARGLAGRMKEAAELEDQEVRRTMSELDARLRQLGARIEKKS